MLKSSEEVGGRVDGQQSNRAVESQRGQSNRIIPNYFHYL